MLGRSTTRCVWLLERMIPKRPAQEGTLCQRLRYVRAGAGGGALDERQLLAPAGIARSFDVRRVLHADRS